MSVRPDLDGARIRDESGEPKVAPSNQLPSPHDNMEPGLTGDLPGDSSVGLWKRKIPHGNGEVDADLLELSETVQGSSFRFVMQDPYSVLRAL